MKRILFFLLCALLVQSVSFAQLPSVKLSLANNKKFDTKNLVDGKTPVVISFWSISCDPCIQEIDALNEAYDDWQEEVPFKLVLVSTDDTRSSISFVALNSVDSAFASAFSNSSRTLDFFEHVSILLVFSWYVGKDKH